MQFLSQHSEADEVLSAQAKDILLVMVAVESFLPRTQLLRLVRAAGIRTPADKPMNEGGLKLAMKEIVAAYPTTHDKRGILGFDFHVANGLCARASGTDRFLAIGARLLKYLRANGLEGMKADDLIYVQNRLLYFLGDRIAFTKAFKAQLALWAVDGTAMNCLYLFYNFDEAFFDGLDERSREAVCLLLHNHMLHFMWDQPAYFSYLAKRLDQIPAAAEILAVFRFLRAEKAEPALAAYPVAKAFAALAKGRYPEALAQFTAAHSRRHVTKPRNGAIYLPSIAGLFAAMTAAGLGEVDGFEQTLAICKKGVREGHVAVRYFNTFTRFVEVHTGASKVPFEMFFPEPDEFAPSFALQIFIGSLWSKWMGNPLPEDELLTIAQAYAREQGYHRIAAEYDRLLYGTSPYFPEQKEKSLLELIHRRDEWELKLAQLEKLAAASERKQDKDDPDQSRLIWEIHEPFEGEFELQPVVQKRTKNGYTKGRKVALSRLVNPMHRPGAATEQDERMMAHIKKSRDYWYGSTTQYEMQREVWIDAIGHPAVFWPGDRQTPVEIVKRNIQLTVEQTETEGYAIRVKEAYAFGHTISLNKVSAHLFEVTELSDQHQLLIEMLHKPLVIPPGHKARLGEVVSRLSSLAMIDSDDRDLLTFSSEVVGDPRAIVHLTPVADTLRAQFLVQPFGEGEGPVFPAGGGGKNVIATIKDTHCLAERDLEAEQRIVNAIVASSLGEASECELSEDNRLEIEGAEACLEFLLGLHHCEEPMLIKWPKGGAVQMRGEIGSEQAHLRASSGQNWFEVAGEIEVDAEQVIQLKELLRIAGDGSSRFVKMSDGSFVALSAHFRNHLDAMKRFGEESEEGIRMPQLALPALDEMAAELDDFQVDAGWKKQLSRIKEMGTIEPDPPNGFFADLRPYQLEGYHWLARLAHWGVGACLADDMGLGKTVQALAMLKQVSDNGPSLVVAPTSVCANWADEAKRFAPGLKCHLLHERDRSTGFDDLGPGDLLIASYGLLVNELDAIQPIKFAVAVLDEAQAIKNPVTRRSKAAGKIQADFKLAMTGTPVENHLGELWSIFRFINPGLLGSLDRFNQRFAAPIERDKDQLALEHLRKLIRPFMLRRHKREILTELPPKTEIELTITPSPEERAFYEGLRQAALENLSGAGEEGAGNERFRILAEIMRLRRACCHPQLVEEQVEIPSSKLGRLMELVDELRENEHQALIFSQFVGHLNLIRAALDEKKITYAYLDGSTPARTRKNEIEAFQAGKYDLFLISLKAGGTGLNLTAADYVIHMDPWWNPAVEDQASDRAHRIGQERPVTIYRLVTQDSIESKIMALHESKRQLAEDLLSGTEMGSRLSADDLLNLIREG